MENLIKELSQYGNVEVLKEDIVLTLFMTKTINNISKFTFDIMRLVNESTDKKIVNVMKNDENYLLLILK